MRLVGWFFPPGQNLPPTLPPQMDNKLSGLDSTFKSHIDSYQTSAGLRSNFFPNCDHKSKKVLCMGFKAAECL